MLSILILPLITILIIGLGGRSIGSEQVSRLITFVFFVCFILTNVTLIHYLRSSTNISLTLFDWVRLESYFIQFHFNFNVITLLMLWLITLISTLVFFYTKDYLFNDPFIVRFYFLIGSFATSMMWLTASSNVILLFVFWELIGLFSFLLIAFWFTRLEAAKSAVLAMVVNRVGDLFLSVSFFLIYFLKKSFSFYSLNSIVIENNLDHILIKVLSVFLILGSLAKSAQFPFAWWLRTSMNGPTPVSSLIHTATLVTAGVFLLMKLSFLIEIHPFAFNLGLILGTMTTIMSGLMAVISKDMKEIIANSTISQIAFLLIAFSIHHHSSALFHLIIHGAFKAGLFLSAGIIIHAIIDNQDIRMSSQLVKNLPFTLINFIILSLSLIGFPTLSGFYSKDLIIELSSMNYHYNYYGFIMTILGMILTSIYSIRLILLSFYKVPTSNEKATLVAKEPSISLLIAISSLSIVSIFLGYLLKDVFFSTIFEYSINEYSANLINEGVLTSSTLITAEFLSKKKKLFILITLITCILTVFTLFSLNKNFEIKLSLKHSSSWKTIYYFLNQRWFIDKFNYGIAYIILSLSHHLSFKMIDRVYLEKKNWILSLESTQLLSSQIFFINFNMIILLGIITLF